MESELRIIHIDSIKQVIATTTTIIIIIKKKKKKKKKRSKDFIDNQLIT